MNGLALNYYLKNIFFLYYSASPEVEISLLQSFEKYVWLTDKRLSRYWMNKNYGKLWLKLNKNIKLLVYTMSVEWGPWCCSWPVFLVCLPLWLTMLLWRTTKEWPQRNECQVNNKNIIHWLSSAPNNSF